MKDGVERVSVEVGEFRSCEEFIEEAKNIRHPFDDSSTLEDDLFIAAFDVLALGLEAVKARADNNFRRWESRAKELEQPEEEAKSKVPAEEQRVLEDKRVMMMGEILKEAGIVDWPNLGQDFCWSVSPG